MNHLQGYDIIVIGVGSMGSATCYHLAKNRIKVLGLEQFSIPNEFSSHAGQSRIIRKAYYEHPDYVPLLGRAYHNWAELEKESGNQIFYKTGLLYAGKPEHPIMQGVKYAASAYHINLDKLTTIDISILYPQLQVPHDYEILFEPDAGFIAPDKAIKAYASLAIQYGGDIRSNIKVESWSKTDTGYEVITNNEIFYCKKIIFTAGPWTSSLLPPWTSKLKATRQLLAWMGTRNSRQFELDKFPCWMITDGDLPGVFYGFPILPETEFDGPIGFKLAYHYPGEEITPDLINRRTNKNDEKLLIEFMHRYFPNEYLSTLEMKICMYTNSPDEHFILDFYPGFNQDVVVAAGFSGHGFKFASVIGEIMSDLAIKGETDLPIEFLRVNRLGDSQA